MTAATPHKAEWNEFGSPEELADALAERIGETLMAAIAARGAASLAVSGGRTPRHLFDALSGLEIAWDKVTIVLVDERFVPPGDERSNARLVRTHLLKDRASRATFVPLYRPTSVEQAAREANSAVSAIPLPLDVAVLGMGPDGHTASFFPDADRLDALYMNPDGTLVLPVFAESAGEPRLTLSLQLLASARFIALHIEGDERRVILNNALADGVLPVARVFSAANAAPQIYWAA